MSRSVGYLISLSGLQFNDADRTSWIHGAPIGKYTHPMYGEVDFSPEKCQRLAESVNNNVVGKQADIDYDHKQYSGEAAGWVKMAETRADGLWLLVEWTKKAYDLIKEGAYRYFSPELMDEWEHPISKAKFKDVLFGGGLTNRPFLKDIMPINMSDLVLTQAGYITEPPKEAAGMDPKKLRELIGLNEDATEEQVQAKLEELTAAPPENNESGNENENENNTETVTVTDAELTELLKEGDLVALSEKLPWVKQMSDTITTLTGKLRLSEIDAQVERVMAPQAGYCIPESQREIVKTALLASPSQQYSDNVLGKMFDTMRSVPLGEIGHTLPSHQRHNDAVENGSKAYSDKIAEFMEKDKIDYATAAERAASQFPQLFGDHRQAATAFEA